MLINDDGDVPLMTLYPALQKLIMGSFSKQQLAHTKTQTVILLALSGHEMLTMTKIAQYISSSNEQATRAVAPLVEEGLVQRQSDAANRTHVLISLTEQGREYVERRRKELHKELEEHIGKSLSEEEQRELFDAVKTVLMLINKIE